MFVFARCVVCFFFSLCEMCTKSIMSTCEWRRVIRIDVFFNKHKAISIESLCGDARNDSIFFVLSSNMIKWKRNEIKKKKSLLQDELYVCLSATKCSILSKQNLILGRLLFFCVLLNPFHFESDIRIIHAANRIESKWMETKYQISQSKSKIILDQIILWGINHSFPIKTICVVKTNSFT